MSIAEPVDLRSALASFDEVWSPRIVTRVNDYDVRIAKTLGEHVWHVHEPSSSGGSILMFEPAGTLTTGDRHDGDLPGNVDSTVGHEL